MPNFWKIVPLILMPIPWSTCLIYEMSDSKYERRFNSLLSSWPANSTVVVGKQPQATPHKWDLLCFIKTLFAKADSKPDLMEGQRISPPTAANKNSRYFFFHSSIFQGWDFWMEISHLCFQLKKKRRVFAAFAIHPENPAFVSQAVIIYHTMKLRWLFASNFLTWGVGEACSLRWKQSQQ